nr:MAG TPA: Protein of unknown function (DUF2634) [Caudoviricetes sp.]
MAIKFNLNTRDLEFDSNKHFAIADKTQDIKQRLILKIELMRGEWYLDENEGIPWLEIFSLTGEEQEKKALNEIRNVLLNDKAVKEIKSLTVEQDNTKSQLVIIFTVLCTDENEYTIEIIKGGEE